MMWRGSRPLSLKMPAGACSPSRRWTLCPTRRTRRTPARSLPSSPCPVSSTSARTQRAQCIQLLSQGERPTVRTAKVYALYGTLTDADVEAVKRYVINPVESREASLATARNAAPRSLPSRSALRPSTGFTAMDEAGLSALLVLHGACHGFGRPQGCCKTISATTERRDPTMTELRVVDTYWSDHCRHTTFSTHLDDDRASTMTPSRAPMQRYLAAREEVYGAEKAAKRPQTLDGYCDHRRKDAAKPRACSPSSTRARRSTPAPSMCPPWWTARSRTGF